jgi:hypothetical protein
MRNGIFVFVFAVVGSSLVGCAAADTQEGVSGEAALTSPDNKLGAKVSGFDFEGPKSLPATDVQCMFFRQPDEEKACLEVGGEATQAAGCAILCSKPIARPGKVAGYDFDGYTQAESTESHCAFIRQPDEDKACSAVGGESTQAADCQILCSKPIAPEGKVAGYDLSGYKVLANDKVPVEFCIASVSEVQERCIGVGGETLRANGCQHLCSLPL